MSVADALSVLMGMIWPEVVVGPGLPYRPTWLSR